MEPRLVGRDDSRWRRTCAVALAVLVAGFAVTGAQSLPLTLPVEADLGAHASLVLADGPQRPANGWDLVAVEDKAVARADALPAALWEVDALAEALGVLEEPAFTFVRDHVAFDPYPGVLRGATGTLAARAGNAWDRALLLRALLDYHGYNTRLAFGELSGEAAAAVIELAAQGAPSPLEPAETDDDAVRSLVTRAWRDHALLTTALGESGALDTLGAGGATSAGLADAVRSHVWVQVEQIDDTWLDLDPTMPDAVPGATLTAVTATADEVPATAQHQVVVRVLVETLEDGALRESVALERALVAADAAGSEVWLYFQPEAQGLGGAIKGALGEVEWQPVLMVDGEVVTGAKFALGANDDSFGGFFGGGGPKLTRLTLELVALAPGSGDRSSKRVLFDRVDPALREAGAVMAETLSDLPNEGVPAALASLHHVLVSTGGMNPREQAIGRAFATNFAGNDLRAEDALSSYSMRDLLFPLAVADQTVVLVSERVIVDGMSGPGMRAFVGAPRAYLVSLIPVAEMENGTASVIDLALDGVAFVSAGTSVDWPAEEARQRLWYGVLQSALETELTLARSRAVDPASAVVDSVSLRMTAPLTVLAPSDVNNVSPSAADLRAALRSGAIAVSVGAPGPTGAFWEVDPGSGATLSVVEPGLRIGFTYGRNYTNASPGGPRYVIDEATGRSIGEIRDGKLYRYNRTPPSRCGGGNEYVTLLGCVSIPAGMTAGMVTGVVVVAIVSWSIAILELLFI